MSRRPWNYAWGEPPPRDPALGFVWRPPRRTGDGDLSDTTPGDEDSNNTIPLRGMAEGVIRVRKVCRQRGCGDEYDSWMFLAEYERERVEDKFSAQEPYFVGQMGNCDPCIRSEETAIQIGKLEEERQRLGRKWEEAKTDKARMFAAMGSLPVLEKLVALTPIGPKYAEYDGKLAQLKEWLEKQRPKKQPEFELVLT